MGGPRLALILGACGEAPKANALRPRVGPHPRVLALGGSAAAQAAVLILYTTSLVILSIAWIGQWKGKFRTGPRREGPNAVVSTWTLLETILLWLRARVLFEVGAADSCGEREVRL